MADVIIDASQLEALADEIRQHSRQTPAKLVAVTSKGALSIKRDWAKTWRGHPTIPYLPNAITYDLHVTPREISAEIGPDPARPQGPLDNIIEFGTSRNAPIPGGAPALAREEGRFLTAVEKIAAGILR
jgi:hypothetical protein